MYTSLKTVNFSNYFTSCEADFAHLVSTTRGKFSYKEVQFKKFCRPIKMLSSLLKMLMKSLGVLCGHSPFKENFIEYFFVRADHIEHLGLPLFKSHHFLYNKFLLLHVN